MDFSAVIIGRNEVYTLERLLKSLKGVDDIVYLDTGSTDGTVEMAKKKGCNVIEVGDKFKVKATKKQYDNWVDTYGYKPSFKIGEGYFHFSKARNHALKFAKNDWCFQPDCDEVVDWDIEKVKKDLENEDQLVYRFCYQHNEDGTCALEFTHSKFFRKSKVRWTKWVHEIHEPVPGKNPKQPKYVDHIYHHHWQNKETNRGNYLPGLELSVLQNPKDDRNTYYLAREYMYVGEYEKSIKMFEHALKIMHWTPEIGQAYIYMGDCYKYLGHMDRAIECYHQALWKCDTRREPFYSLGSALEEKKEIQRAIFYYRAALEVPFKEHGYINNKDLYGWIIHDKLAQLYSQLGEKEKARVHWLVCLKQNPDRRILSNLPWFYKTPRISIIVPTVRPKGYNRLIKSIEENTLYPDYEIIKKDGEGTAIEKFNKGVEEASGELVVFMADDTEATLGWLTQAYIHFVENFRDRGLVIFNDGHWQGTLANHFLVSKNIRDELDGEIWHGGYNHSGADDELYGRLKKKGLIEYCEDAKIKHYHYYAQTEGVKRSKKDKYYKRIEAWMEQDRALLKDRKEKIGF